MREYTVHCYHGNGSSVKVKAKSMKDALEQAKKLGMFPRENVYLKPSGTSRRIMDIARSANNPYNHVIVGTVTTWA